MRRESQHGSGVTKTKRKHKNKKTSKKNANLITNSKKIIKQIQAAE